MTLHQRVRANAEDDHESATHRIDGFAATSVGSREGAELLALAADR